MNSGPELADHFHCLRISQERLLCLWGAYVKADPSDHAGSDKADVKGFLSLHGVPGETEGSNATCRELIQAPHIT